MGFKEEVYRDVPDVKTTNAPNIPLSETYDGSKNIIKGTFSKAMSFTVTPKDTFKDQVLKAEATAQLGYKPEDPSFVVDPKMVQPKVETFKDKVLRGALGEVLIDAPLQGVAKQGDKIATKLGPIWSKVTTALSIDEHLMIKGAYSIVGAQPKKDISDYTYTSMYRDLYKNYGSPTNEGQRIADEALINSLGIASSILLVPSTYLTFGESAMTKLGVNGLRLTKSGSKMFLEAAKEAAELKIATKEYQTGIKLTAEEANAIRQQTKFETEQQLIKRFGEINEVNKNLEISAPVMSIPENVVKQGKGARLQVPLTGQEIPLTFGQQAKDVYKSADILNKGEIIIPGAEVAKTVINSGLNTFGKITTNIAARLNKIPAINDRVEEIKKLKDGFGELFIYNYGIDRKMVDYFKRAGTDAETLLKNPGAKGVDVAKVNVAYTVAKWEEMGVEAKKLAKESSDFAKKYFSDLSNTEKGEFSEAMIQASIKSTNKFNELKLQAQAMGVNITPQVEEALRAQAKEAVTHANPKIQEKLDQFIGQGKYEGKGLADELAQKSKLLEQDRLPIWFPGVVDKYIEKMSFRLPKDITPAEREFLTPKKMTQVLEESTGRTKLIPEYSDMYTRDPVKAVGVRLTQIAHANLQDKFFEGLVQQGMIKRFENYQEAIAKGYVPVRRPTTNILMQTTEDVAGVLKNEPLYFVQKDLYSQYKNFAGTSVPQIPIVTPFLNLIKPGTQLTKGYVTSIFPSFHARNFNSNIIQNSYSIGLQAFNPAAHARAIKALVIGGVKDKPETLLEKIHFATVEMIFGKEGGKYTNAVGEQLTSKALIKEAEEHGAITGGLYQADIGGMGLRKDIGESWTQTLRRHANPFSKDFAPLVFGRNFGNAIETQARMVNYTTWRMRGLSPSMAAMETNQALVDYSKVTGFEKMLNQTIIPFYTWRRKNLENHLLLAKANPGFITAQMKYLRDSGPSDAELKTWPEWARKQFVVNFKGNFYGGFGLPFEDVIQLADDPKGQILSMVNPMLKYQIENATGKDFFSGRDTLELNNANEFKEVLKLANNKNAPSFLKEPAKIVKDWLELQLDPSNPLKVIGNPDKLHILRNSFTGRIQSTLGMLQKQDIDPYNKALRFVLGIQKIEPNMDLQLSLEKKKATTESREQVLRTNTARPITRIYWYSDDKDAAELANDWQHEIDKAETTQELEMVQKQYKTLTELTKDAKVGKKAK